VERSVTGHGDVAETLTFTRNIEGSHAMKLEETHNGETSGNQAREMNLRPLQS
jgi:hypothetical protein